MEKAETFDPSFFKVSWIVDMVDGPDRTSFALSNYQPEEGEKKYRAFGLCSCPGKNLEKGRDGKTHQRNIDTDVKYFREFLKVDTIICLLDPYELRTIGVDCLKYQKACQKYGVEFIQYPIIEMGVPPHSPSDFDSKVIKPLLEKICNRKRVICHCRGGIGRAGTVASCVLLKLGLTKDHKNTITTVRKLRDPKAVESQKQEDYIRAFSKIKSIEDIS